MTTFETLSAWILALTVVAIVVGPIAAVIVTRIGDERREAKRRKSEVLATLMRTRMARLSFEHVGALNLVQLEFYGVVSVQTAYSRYMAHLNTAEPKDERPAINHREERADLFIELLHQIAAHLGYGFDKKDLEKLGYGPQGWEDDQNAIRMLRSMAMDVMMGKQSLSVVMRPSQAPSDKFPPAPPVTPGDAGVT